MGLLDVTSLIEDIPILFSQLSEIHRGYPAGLCRLKSAHLFNVVRNAGDFGLVPLGEDFASCVSTLWASISLVVKLGQVWQVCKSEDISSKMASIEVCRLDPGARVIVRGKNEWPSRLN